MELHIKVTSEGIGLGGSPELLNDPLRVLGLLEVAKEIVHAQQRAKAQQPRLSLPPVDLARFRNGNGGAK